MKKLVLFASGNGSNVQNIIENFPKDDIIIFTNNPNAKVIEKAHKKNCLTIVFSKKQLLEGVVLKKLEEIDPDIIVLAGFLLQFPVTIIEKFNAKIINIHPALLPKYGGKGMYGNHVHQAVLENKEAETGITIHFVNENYDEGAIIFQKSISIKDCKFKEEVAQKVQELEHRFLPKVILEILETCNKE